jgi:hypothetical protein
MKNIIKFKAVGGLTFSEKSNITDNKQERINRMLSLLGIISFFAGIFWDDISNWFRKRVM